LNEQETMPVLTIIQPDNPILRRKANKIANFKDKKLQTLIDDMLKTMRAANGVGLAAPQVAESIRLIVIRLPDADEEDRAEYGEHAGKTYIVANPKIIKASPQMVTDVEGCLSLPGWLGEVERHQSVVVTGQDRHGKDFRMKAHDWLARVFQHEIDHLDGRLFIDITTKIWRADEEPPDAADKAEAEITTEES
jgi:peptide deformylase